MMMATSFTQRGYGVASIQVIQGPDRGLTFELGQGESTLGRQGSTVTLNDGTVSRRHACIIGDNGTWMLRDMGSANGTFLNGVKLRKPARLNGGDQIRTGSTLLLFVATNGTMPQVDVDEDGRLIDAAIVATVPSNEDSVIIPTPEAGVEALDSLRILYDTIAEISSIFNVSLLLRRMLSKIFDVLQADRGYVMLVDEKGKLRLVASRVTDETKDGQIPISRTIINEVITKQVGAISSNAMSDKRFTSGKSVHNFGIRSAICVPIKGRDRILGVIHVDCRVAEHTYTTQQLRLLTAIGYHTGLAIENVRLYEAAVQSERLAAVGETVAALSHHIKNILQALMAGTDVVEMGLDQGNLDKSRLAWPIVQRNLGRINATILNMLAFSKDRQPLLENVDLPRLVTECVELITPQADERGVMILSDFDDMPSVPADPAGIHQAVLNLLNNALDAVPDQTGAVTVSCKYDSMHRQAVLRVIDNGHGIEQAKLDEIFHPFYSDKGQRGTGLGLAVAKKVCKEHGGTIKVSSKIGEGTRFTITLSAIPATAGDPGDTVAPSRH